MINPIFSDIFKDTDGYLFFLIFVTWFIENNFCSEKTWCGLQWAHRFETTNAKKSFLCPEFNESLVSNLKNTLYLNRQHKGHLYTVISK